MLGVKPDRVRKLCRQGKLYCEKLSWQWMVDEESANIYAHTERKPGPKPDEFEYPIAIKTHALREKVYEQKEWTITVILTSDQLYHVLSKYASLSNGIRSLIEADMKQD